MVRPRFLLDAHLRPLAFWLRWLGYDTLLLARSPCSSIEVRAIKGRIYVTTSKRGYGLVLRTGKAAVLLPNNCSSREQLRHLLRTLDLKPSLRFNRCPLCNTLLDTLERKRALSKVPEGVKASSRGFWICPHCNKIYWEGDHVARIREIYRFYIEKEG